MIEILQKAENLKEELDALRPLNNEAEARIMQKFRLDWNYHSNNLEGNSLTFGETKALLLHGITAGAKPLKDYLEIKGHDEAIKWIEEIIKDETPLGETFIRQLHTLILKEPYEIDAQTLDGNLTKRLIKVGEYKTHPNHVLTQTGEMFYFAEPFETPIKMRELVDWFRGKKETDFNPILLAAEFHYKFIRIHPFDDGNGRIARILMNFILMQYGFPPVVIKTEDKQNYIFSLQQADAGIYEPFFEYIAKNLVHSLEIMVKGAKGESIEESDDLDKELALLERKLTTSGKNLKVDRNFESTANVFGLSIKPLLERIKEVCEKFDRFYVSNRMILDIDGRESEFIKNQSFYSINDDIWFYQNTEIISFEYLHNTLKQAELQDVNYVTLVTTIFDLTKYSIKIFLGEGNERVLIKEKNYSEFLTEIEIEEIVKLIAQKHKKFIEDKLNQILSN